MVPPRNATSRRPPVGQLVQVAGEVADDAAHPQARIVGGDLRRWTARSALTRHVERHERAPAPPLPAKRVQQQPGLLRRAGAQLDRASSRR